ncbi:MAG: MBL fold metallo-hydrolase [Candidatus Peregrinibacteria bacterium]|nr:MBL fold metallo-hydrolase [Candidatus Peregrinibacteria bacterium]
MKILFAGAAGEVTGSKHLITFNNKKILLDCGMFQGKRKETYEKNVNLGFDPKELDAVILSHAHIDHSGDLPILVKNGFSGPIYCTHATRDLCNYMLMDSAFIQESEIEYLKKKKKLKKDDIKEPLYTSKDAEKVLQLFRGIGYEQSFVVVDGMVVSFYDAGHILGSALTHMVFYDKVKKKHLKLCFTGDLGRRGLPILRDPQPIPPTDVLISECTYGNRLHKAIQTIKDDLAVIVNSVCKNGGKLIIPAFALERTQEIVYHLNILTKEKRIPEIPIYVDSPLAGNVTEVFRTHIECFSKEVMNEFVQNGENPFGFGRLKYTRSVEESKSLNEKRGPMIIIAASGMCEHGRILHHLKNNIENKKNVILIVGYQAENTLGRKLVEGMGEVNIFGDTYKVGAEVYVMDAFSAHADRSDLLDYIGRIKQLKKIFLVHGEQKQLDAFSSSLKENGYKDVYVPKAKEEVEIVI